MKEKNQVHSSSFWQFSTDYWFKQLNSSPSGLTDAQASAILHSIPGKKKAVAGFKKDMLLFAGQFRSPLMLLLIGAVIISAFLGDRSDVFIILFIVLSTGLLSFFQERNAGRVVEKLQRLIALKSIVTRSGRSTEIHSDEVVPGDIVQLSAGDMIAADCLLIASNELHVNEASLTGESFPVRKIPGVVDENARLTMRTNALWQGTSVVSGTGTALVIHTADQTIFGNIVQSASVVTETSFEKGIRQFGYFLMKISIFLCVFILVANILHHKTVVESALFALALAVGMAPELLPAITTIAMSAGAKRMFAKKVIVKKLSAIQNLGEVNLLCTDKTGTITGGEMVIDAITNIDGVADEFVKTLACLNAKYETGYRNPIDAAINALSFNGAGYEKVGEIPYDFIRKRISVVVEKDGKKLLITKGAYDKVCSICSSVQLQNNNTADIKLQWQKLNDLSTQKGLEGKRVIAVCYKQVTTNKITREDECDMIFAGFIFCGDPVKPGIKDTIDEMRNLGVELKIITGDNRNIAKATALEIGIKDPIIITGTDLLNVSPEAIIQKVKPVHIFAEVEPQQKERIIHALRKSYTIAYMGDGINDVSALNAADIGISVENAVDVAKDASDFVLMEKNLDVLTEGIKEGRKTFANTLKYIYISTGSTFGNMCSVAFASLLLPFLPMLPKQILLTNFITDFPYLTIASDRVDEEQLTRPGKWNMKLIRDYMIFFGVHSSLFDIITFLTLLFILKAGEAAFQTGWFIESVLSELFILFIIRTHKNFFKSRPGKYLLILSVIGCVATLLFPYLPFTQSLGMVPLPAKIFAAMIGIVVAYIITADLLKVWFFSWYLKKRFPEQ
ncbi:MAG: magnesium-translocating P-type ATPase [Bacteroidetes bacterium]|nr:magnesium-translocating P-type ATPase [Bacteroidota bacterium]